MAKIDNPAAIRTTSRKVPAMGNAPSSLFSPAFPLLPEENLTPAGGALR